MTTHLSFYRCKQTPILTLVLLCCLQSLFLSCKPKDSVDPGIPPITSEMFFHQVSHQGEIVIDAGTLGRYRFSPPQSPDIPHHIIRQELIDLLNTLQGIFKQPMHIIDGYRSQQHQIYLWAKWCSEHPEQITALNAKTHATWEAWVQASQALPGCPPLQSKHQTGEAVNFYWETLAIDSDEQRLSLTEQIRKAGGVRDYTPAQRTQFNIPAADNYLFAVTAHPAGKAGPGENSAGRAYFHVEHQPSAGPAMPRINDIGALVALPEPPPAPVPPPAPPPAPEPPPTPEPPPVYTRGEILVIEAEGYKYYAEVTADTKRSATEVPIRFFVETIRQKVGDKTPANTVVGKREKPQNGWGSQKILLQYFDGQQWIVSKNVTVFEDHYLLPESIVGERKLSLNQVRIPIFQTK